MQCPARALHFLLFLEKKYACLFKFIDLFARTYFLPNTKKW